MSFDRALGEFVGFGKPAKKEALQISPRPLSHSWYVTNRLMSFERALG
jgi:hypothetical protein